MPYGLSAIEQFVQPYLGRPYQPGECWRIVQELLVDGGFLMPEQTPMDAVTQVQEIWWQDDPRDPLTLVQPWDWFLLRYDSPAVGHPGLVVDATRFVHVHRKAGVVLEPMRRWQPRLIQIARLRALL